MARVEIKRSLVQSTTSVQSLASSGHEALISGNYFGTSMFHVLALSLS